MGNYSDKKRPKKILIIHSAPKWLFERFVYSLSGSAEEFDIDVYSPRILSANLKTDNRFSAIIDDNWDGIFRSANITKSLVSKLTENKYARIIILYNDISGDKYGAIRRLAFKAKPGVVYSFNVDQNCSVVTQRGTLNKGIVQQMWLEVQTLYRLIRGSVVERKFILVLFFLFAFPYIAWIRYQIRHTPAKDHNYADNVYTLR